MTVFAGTDAAMAQGAWVLCVCLGACLLMGPKSTTLLGDPSAFGVMCILEHQRSGVLTGTLSMTPNRTSRSKPSRTLSCQASGTCDGFLIAIGLAWGSTYRQSGSLLFISGKTCLSHTLKAEQENLSRMNCFRIGRFSGVGSHGRGGVSVGGRVRSGHLQGWSDCVGTPLFVHVEREGVDPEAAANVDVEYGVGGQDPIVGKFVGKV